MNQNTSAPEPAEARVKKRGNISSVWLLPVVALFIVVWLVWKAISEAGVTVDVQFQNGRGIKQGKTEVRLNGIAVGKVTAMAMSEDLKSVNVTLEMDRRMSNSLTENSRFWLVQPQVSVAGISGLDTLVSGNYIAFQPADTGIKRKKFIALSSPPPLGEQENGLSLTLRAKELSSIQNGSPVYYRRLKIGEVSSYDLSADDQYVDVEIFIKPQFAHLVRRNTRFWNAGGIELSGSLTNLKVRAQSIASMIQGGVSLYTPEWEQEFPEAYQGDVFPLYRDYDEAEAGIAVEIDFPLDVALGQGKTRILFHGMEVGLIKDTELKDDYSGIVANAVVRPDAVNLMVKGARFWLVKPSIGLHGVSGLETLLSGRYINMDVSSKDIKAAAPERHFKGLANEPPASPSAPGLHLNLRADSLAGISHGSPVLFRKMQVGSVQSHELSDDGVLVKVLIDPAYQHLINSSSRFWNVSGITLQGGLQGFSIKVGTLNSMLAGGIAFDTPDKTSNTVKNGTGFVLFNSVDQAHQTGQKITLIFETAEGLQVGTKVKYKGLVVGQLTGLKLNKEKGHIEATTLLKDSAEWVAQKGSRFWLVRPRLGLANSANLETLVTGQYIEVQPANRKDAVAKMVFTVEMTVPDDKPLNTGLRLQLVSDQLGSIRRGNPVYYREIPVGKVTGYRLADPASHVLIFINIEDRYTSLVTEKSRFWNASGVDVKFGLFSGAKIRTESLEALLAGGIAFATPEVGEPVSANHQFKMAKEADSQWLNWAPAISLGDE
ncbi:PqiB family protein [Endozoicomonas montiporae]|uniref:Paraquat-inducible protein B n=2 Tax=Endozoicomonas montiporae TaxID=1027273 RepID=A0A142BIV1_9GAMM|nr:MlaD family protein [Endozoicomonas montiporae]AMO58677.1 paraquat-inducible protein B [Endozoicomonas montiporae CL-33]